MWYRANTETPWGGLRNRTIPGSIQHLETGRGLGTADLHLPVTAARDVLRRHVLAGQREIGMGALRAPRFFGDEVLAACLDGHRIFDGSGDPAHSVPRYVPPLFPPALLPLLPALLGKAWDTVEDPMG